MGKYSTPKLDSLREYFATGNNIFVQEVLNALWSVMPNSVSMGEITLLKVIWRYSELLTSVFFNMPTEECLTNCGCVY